MASPCQGWNGQFICVFVFCFGISWSDSSDLTISVFLLLYVCHCELCSNGQGKGTSNDPQTSAATTYTCWQLKIWSNAIFLETLTSPKKGEGSVKVKQPFQLCCLWSWNHTGRYWMRLARGISWKRSWGDGQSWAQKLNSICLASRTLKKEDRKVYKW